MTNTITNRQAIFETLASLAGSDRDVVALFSDSRGSASMGAFFDQYPEQAYEVGIAEQNLVGIAAGLASCGKKSFVFSPACFLAARSYEQIKVDVAYSHTNVKLIGISGGVSYGTLGMSHHSIQDIAAMASIPNMRVYLPCDRFQTAKLVGLLAQDVTPAYIRIGRNAVEDVYDETDVPLVLNRANVLCEGTDIGLIACGETVRQALDAATLLRSHGISARVVDMYCLQPLDEAAVLETANKTKQIVTVEEHVLRGGLGSAVAQVVCQQLPGPVHCLALPDEPLLAGSSKELFAHYGIDAAGIANTCRELCGR